MMLYNYYKLVKYAKSPVLIVSALFLCLWLGSYYGFKRGKQSGLASLKGMNDTLRTWKDKDRLNHAQISSITADRNALLDVIDQRAEDIRALLKDKHVTGVTQIQTETKFDTVVVANNTSEDCRASFEFDNGFIAADIKVHRDTMSFKNLLVRNELTIDHKEEQDRTIIHVKQSNPYTQTTYLKDYVIERPKVKNHWLKNLLIGAVIGTVAGLTLR